MLRDLLISLLNILRMILNVVDFNVIRGANISLAISFTACSIALLQADSLLAIY